MKEGTEQKLQEIMDYIISDLWQKCDDAAADPACEAELYRALQRFALFAKGCSDIENDW